MFVYRLSFRTEKMTIIMESYFNFVVGQKTPWHDISYCYEIGNYSEIPNCKIKQ